MVDVAYTFSGRDFTTEFNRLLALLKVELPEYTDWNHSDAGIVILRLIARETDQLNDYIDRVFAEGFLATAQFKQSLVDLGRLVGYLPTLSSPASTRLQFTRIEGVTGAISIPKYTSVLRSDGLSYLTIEAVTIQSDEDTVEVGAIQGETNTLTITENDFDVTDWTSRPRYNLGAGVVSGYVQIAHGSPATVWTEVDSFWRSWMDDFHYLLELNGDTDETWLVCGDGVQGAQIPEGAITIEYVTTAGASGNTGAYTVTTVPEALAESVTCTNIEIATGGAAPETIASLRQQIPAVTRTQRRGLTKADYEALIGHIPGVLHVSALDRNNSSIWPHDHIVVYVVPEGGGPMSTLLQSQILSECAEWGHLGAWEERYILLDAIEDSLNITCRIGVAQGYTTEGVRSAVIAALNEFLAAEQRTIGGSVTITELRTVVSAVPGVSWEEFSTPVVTVTSQPGHIITPGVISVSVSQ